MLLNIIINKNTILYAFTYILHVIFKIICFCI